MPGLHDTRTEQSKQSYMRNQSVVVFASRLQESKAHSYSCLATNGLRDLSCFGGGMCRFEGHQRRVQFVPRHR